MAGSAMKFAEPAEDFAFLEEVNSAHYMPVSCKYWIKFSPRIKGLYR